jgi:hypothetical protein
LSDKHESPHFRVEGRRTWFEIVHQMQDALDANLATYNETRPHQGHGMNGTTPARASIARIPANDSTAEGVDHKGDQIEAV